MGALDKVLNSPEISAVFLHVVAGQDYALEISRHLPTKQNTISFQLGLLEKSGLIEKGRRDKAQHYEPNWTRFFGLWTQFLEDEFYFRTEFIDAMHEKNTNNKAATLLSSYKENSEKKIEHVFKDKLFKQILVQYLSVLGHGVPDVYSGRSLKKIMVDDFIQGLAPVAEGLKHNKTKNTEIGKLVIELASVFNLPSVQSISLLLAYCKVTGEDAKAAFPVFD